MKITVNRETIDCSKNIQLDTLLSQLGKIAINGIAISINNQIIPKKNWPHTNINENDNITIITATQGGYSI
jgi:sulfur carrier protein